MGPSFDLVTQPWVPVRVDGRLHEVSLEECLLGARVLERIEDPSPLVTAALHRFLVAVLRRALRGPHDVEQAANWLLDGFDEQRIRAYLAEHGDRFDLFHQERPFYQVPDFGLELSRRSWTILAPELNSDNNKMLFDHTVTARPEPLSPAAAARLIISNQTFALSAGKSVFCHTATAPLATAATVLAMGRNLHETLCLNLVAYPPSQQVGDSAPWERPPLRVEDLRECDGPRARDAPAGVVDLNTWPARAIRLHPEVRDGTAVIFWISYASGVRCDNPVIVLDPLAAYRQDAKDAARVYPLGFREERALWRDFHALLPKPDGATGAKVLGHVGALTQELADRREATVPVVTIVVLGQANDQAKVEFWRQEAYQLSAALLSAPGLSSLIEDCLARAKQVGDHLNTAARALAKYLLSRGERQPHKDDIASLIKSLPHAAAYWSALEREFAHWLAGLTVEVAESPQATRADWEAAVRRAVWRAWNLATQAAGDDAHALRAVAIGQGLLARAMASAG